MPTRAEVVPLTPRLQQVLSSAERIAGRTPPYIGVEHVFIATLEDPDSVPAQALTEAGVSAKAIAKLVRDILRSPAYAS